MDSSFWKGLIKVKEDFFKRGSFIIGNGENAQFWEDVWLGTSPLAEQYPSLYNIAQRKQVSVANVMSQTPPLNLRFRRALTGDKRVAWFAFS